MIMTVCGDMISEKYIGNYVSSLVNCFYKILPMREDGEPSLQLYMEGLRRELIGCGALIPILGEEPMYSTLLCILQSFIDHPDTAIADVKRDVFRAITICKNLSGKILRGEEIGDEKSKDTAPGGDET